MVANRFFVGKEILLLRHPPRHQHLPTIQEIAKVVLIFECVIIIITIHRHLSISHYLLGAMIDQQPADEGAEDTRVKNLTTDVNRSAPPPHHVVCVKRR